MESSFVTSTRVVQEGALMLKLAGQLVLRESGPGRGCVGKEERVAVVSLILCWVYGSFLSIIHSSQSNIQFPGKKRVTAIFLSKMPTQLIVATEGERETDDSC